MAPAGNARAVPPVAWVRPPEPIRGLDHLGVQAPCIALYGQLLPGITNVTDRARYYSFHPWLLWSFEKRFKNHSLDELRRVVRRAECLFSLIAIRHARRLGEKDEFHGQGMVGRDQLLRIDESDSFSLDVHAAFEGPTRYFKNKLGALGQYYFGPLRDLRILDRTDSGASALPGYDRDRGRALAESFASSVPEDTFFRMMESHSSAWQDLDELEAFCPCRLHGNAPEHSLLLDLFLARTERFRSDGGTERRASLGLLLDLAGRPADPEYAFEGLLRGSAYAGTLVDGSAWQVASAFQRAQRGWGTYQRNELLSLALQGLFAAVLRAVERDRQGRLNRVDEAADVAVALLGLPAKELQLSLTERIARHRATLPSLADWKNPDHEVQCGWKLQGLRLDDDQLETVATESVRILLSLLARGVDEYPYADFELDPEYFDPREVHLLSLRQVSHREWADLSVGAWVRWLAIHWGTARHLRVALRKLRGEQRDTFRIRPLEGELRVVEAPEPTYTIPRVAKTAQILRDLGLVATDDAGNTVLTEELGKRELEACRAG